jgi:hypothetical protein
MTGSSSRLSSFGGEKCHHSYKRILSNFFAYTMKWEIFKMLVILQNSLFFHSMEFKVKKRLPEYVI